MFTYARILLLAVAFATPGAQTAVGQTNTPPAGKAIEKTIYVSGSLMDINKWRTTHVRVRQGSKVTISVYPVETLGKPEEYSHEALAFRVGPTGLENLVDSNGRSNWQVADDVDRRVKVWKYAPLVSFTAEQDGFLFYATRQIGKFTGKVVVTE